jgi:endonuclease/exonuclease/phosphatase family metal-dependent hydrolase
LKKILLLTVLIVSVTISCAKNITLGPVWDIDQPVTASYVSDTPDFDGKLQVIAYNIERGFFPDDIANYIEGEMENYPATVLLLSELDRNHSRTKDIFVADELARRLNMNVVYATEFIEYNDQTPDTQGDHGNAILSPFPITDVTLIRHTVEFDWQKKGHTQDEPRFGNRVTIGANIALPGGNKVRVYTAHLESNADTFGKWRQMSEIIEDAEKYDLPVVIGGDFNELPGWVMFQKFPKYDIKNAFSGDRSKTGGCNVSGAKVKCLIKIDWIVYRDLALLESSVDYPVNWEGDIISDHCPVRSVFGID